MHSKGKVTGLVFVSDYKTSNNLSKNTNPYIYFLWIFIRERSVFRHSNNVISFIDIAIDCK